MNIIIKDHMDSETGIWAKSFAWKHKINKQEYGSYILSRQAYLEYNKEMYIKNIETLLDQAEDIIKMVEKNNE